MDSREPVPAVTLLGIILYGIQRLGATIFYNKLGFSPDDVGFGYASGIAQAVFGICVYAFVMAVTPFIVALPFVPFSLARSVWLRIQRPAEAPSAWKRARSLIGTVRRNMHEEFLSTLVIAGAISLPLMSAWTDGSDALAGNPQTRQFGTSWSATAAQIHVLSPNTGLDEGACLLLLGNTDGFAVFFDPATGQGHRVPTSAVTIATGGALDDVEKVPRDC